jgi:site-specific DNA-methyltransferase (adenine-specific)
MKSIFSFAYFNPTERRDELIGDMPTPFRTLLNGNAARVDGYGRIWSPYLKNRFPMGSWVEISKTENGFHVDLVKNLDKGATIKLLEEKSLITNEQKGMKRHFGEISVEDVGRHVGKMQRNDKLYFNVNSMYIYNDDFLKTDVIRDDSVDLIVTSPPYNVDIKYENYNDKIPYSKYLEFTKKWLTKCYDLVKWDGRFCLNIPLDKFKGGHQSVYADITTIAKDVGWKYHSTIIWNEQNISRRTAWGSWLSASAPFVIAPVEVIAVLYKKRWKKTSGSGKSDISREEFIEWTNGVWNFSGESKTKVGHPSPFPIELPKRCMKLFSFVGDTVLDPFLGSGTTLIACLETKRVGIGVEIDRKYCELAKSRLEEYEVYQQRLT